jgi:hypothetical protein
LPCLSTTGNGNRAGLPRETPGKLQVESLARQCAARLAKDR